MWFPHSITVTVSHREVDRNGDYTVTDSYRLPGCVISLSSRNLAQETETFERDSVRAVTTLYAPTGSDIRGADIITLDDGTVWHVWGLPTEFSSPFTGWQPGMKVSLHYFKG